MTSTQIQILSNKFNTLMTKYQKTYADFINSINSNGKTFLTLENNAFTGTNVINKSSSRSISDCQKACSSNALCSGATFQNKKCTLTSGTGSIVNSTNSTAIVKESMYYSYQLQQLNQQLININQEINNNVNHSTKEYQNNLGVINEREKALEQNYVVLTKEGTHIEKMVRDFETLNSAQENVDIKVTTNYYNYIALIFIVILLIFLFFHFSMTSQQYGGKSRNLISKFFD
jgi:lipopolysaccharide export LptBFGC system permease protein LptF